MKKNLTEIVFLLDRSGSMAGLESDTIGGYNAFLEKQKKAEGEAIITTVLFDTTRRVLYDRADLNRIGPMREDDYCVGGCTALMDALGDTIDHMTTVHKYAREEDVPERTIFVITTDGMENASRRFTLNDIRLKIDDCKRNGWEFLFLGANIDAVETARTYGIPESHSVRFHSDPCGTRLNYEVLSDAVMCMRKGHALRNNWKSRIEKDYASRAKNSSST